MFKNYSVGVKFLGDDLAAVYSMEYESILTVTLEQGDASKMTLKDKYAMVASAIAKCIKNDAWDFYLPRAALDSNLYVFEDSAIVYRMGANGGDFLKVVFGYMSDTARGKLQPLHTGLDICVQVGYSTTRIVDTMSGVDKCLTSLYSTKEALGKLKMYLEAACGSKGEHMSYTGTMTVKRKNNQEFKMGIPICTVWHSADTVVSSGDMVMLSVNTCGFNLKYPAFVVVDERENTVWFLGKDRTCRCSLDNIRNNMIVTRLVENGDFTGEMWGIKFTPNKERTEG